MHAVPGEARRGQKIPAMSAGNGGPVLWDQYVLLTTELSLQPQY